MSLIKDDATSILKQYDNAFFELTLLKQCSTYGSSAKSYTAAYTDTHKEAHTLSIITGSIEALNAQVNLISTITSNTSLPVPTLLHRSPSTSPISSPYILLSHPSPPHIPLSSTLPTKALAAASLSLGAHLHTLHSRVQNDWFGIPGEEKEWGECYSWQEAFSLLVENALAEIEARGILRDTEGEGEKEDDAIPVEELRHALGRAIGFFLFDDVEVPSLIWCPSPSYAARAFISSPSTPDSDPDPLKGLTNFTVSIWGDPLLEGAFHPPGPSAAFLEGYGGTPIVFARQHTKRLWYTAYAALQALLTVTNDSDSEGDVKREKEARETLKDVARKLKDAPCY